MKRLLVAWILSAAVAAAQIVEGRVVNSENGKGIAGVAIGLLAMGQVDYRTITDGSGGFKWEGVKDGSYTPFYTSPDFIPVNMAPAGPFKVTAGGAPVELELKMAPKIKISGRVLDGTGKPVANATLSLTQVGAGGMAYLFPGDAKGNFHGPDALQAGSWILSATAPAAWPLPEPQDGEKLGWTRTFYPSVTDEALSIPITASSANELTNLDIKLATVPVHRLSGVILDPGGKPMPKMTVVLDMRNPGGFPSPSRDAQADDGKFDFEAVAAGEYQVSAAAILDGIRLWAMEPVQMKDRDLENLEVHLAPPFSMPGKVVMEVPEGQTAPKLPRVRLAQVELSIMSSRPGAPTAAAPNERGEFTFGNVFSGRYLIDLDPAPAPYYLDSIRMGGESALADDVPISSGAAPITVTYKLNGGTVRGTVESCGGGRVLLIPRDAAYRRYGFTYMATCGDSGRFEISNVRPGDYYGFAIAKGEPIPEMRTLDQSTINQSARVSVRAGESTQADLRLVAR